MRSLSLLVALCLLAAHPLFLVAQTPIIDRPVSFGLPDGTPVKLRLARNLSSADAKTGEMVDFEVIEEIRAGNVVVIPKGSTAIATVTRAKPKGRLGRGGKLDVNIDYVRTSLGEKVALRAVKETKGSNTGTAMTTAIVASTLLFWPAAPFFLLMKGKEMKIPKGTEITAYVAGNTELNPDRYSAAETLLDQKPATTQVGLVSVAIQSDPEGADIFVDGNFVGSTPSSVYLKSGEHTISVRKPGFKNWERFMRMTPGSNVTVRAQLDKSNL
jgi:hypothetical protein